MTQREIECALDGLPYDPLDESLEGVLSTIAQTAQDDAGREHVVGASAARQALLDLLWDGCGHSWRELEKAAGNRFNGRIFELRQEGWYIDAESDPSGVGQVYRLADRVRGPARRPKTRVYLSDAERADLLAGRVPASVRSRL